MQEPHLVEWPEVEGPDDGESGESFEVHVFVPLALDRPLGH